MRTLKKSLSLVLVLAMVFSFCAMGTSAAYVDADEISAEYLEAVDVMSALNVLKGDENGFRPADTLTRAEACVIIIKMLGAMDLVPAAKTDKFTDISGHWAEEYIAYCVEQGLISGIGDNKFGPNDELSGYAFALMLLRACGYNPKNEGIGGASWELNTAKTAMAAGLIDDLTLVSAETFTREMAAQLAFQTLDVSLVYYAGGTEVLTEEGLIVTVNPTRYTFNKIANRDYSLDDVNENDATLELCEKYFPALSLISYTTDGMARPAHEWLLKKDAIGLYVDTPDYVEFVTASNNTLGKVVDSVSKRFNDTYADVYVNGVAVEELDVDTSAARGNIVELYMDKTDATVVDRIVITHKTVGTFMAATSTVVGTTTYISIPGVVSAVPSYMVTGYEELDPYTCIMFYTDAWGCTYIEAADLFTGVMTATTDATGKVSVTAPEYFHIDGETYQISGQTNSIEKADLLTYRQNGTAVYWVDNAGYIIAAAADIAAPEYMLVLKNDTFVPGNVFEGSKIRSQVVFVNEEGNTEIVDISKVLTAPASTTNAPEQLDSTEDVGPYDHDSDVDTADVYAANADKANSTLYTYAQNADGSYTLKASCGSLLADATSIVTGIPSSFEDEYADKYITNDATIYLVRDIKNGKFVDTYTVYTGYKTVPSMNVAENGAIVVPVGDSNYAQYVVINDYAPATTTAGAVAYVLDNDITAVYKADGQVDHFEVSAIIDGVKTVLEIADGAYVEAADGTNDRVTTTTLEELEELVLDHTIYEITYTDGEATELYEAESSAKGAPTRFWVNLEGSVAANKGIIVLDDTSFAYAEDAVVYTISAIGDIVTKGDITSLATDANDKISVVVVDGTAYGTAKNNTVVEVYVYQQLDTIDDDDDTVLPETSVDTRYDEAYAAAGITASLDGTEGTILVDKSDLLAFMNLPTYATQKAAMTHAGELYVGYAFAAPAATATIDVVVMKDGAVVSTTADYADGVYHEYFHLTEGGDICEGHTWDVYITWTVGTQTINEHYTITSTIAD